MRLLAILGTMLFAGTVLAQGPSAKVDNEVKKLDFMLGEWSGKETVYMEPGQKPTPVDSAWSIKSYLSGRYLRLDNKSTMPGLGPYEGCLMITFDPVSKKYKAYWFDSMSAEQVIAEGTFENNKLVMMANQMQGTTPMSFRITYELKGKSELGFLMESKTGDKFEKAMEGSYKKK